jgi:hypothetical protein
MRRLFGQQACDAERRSVNRERRNRRERHPDPPRGIAPAGGRALRATVPHELGYRFIRYYTGNPAYRRKGPPALILRLLGPMVLLSTLGVLATGGILLVVGPSRSYPGLLLHKATFIIWVASAVVGALILALLLIPDFAAWTAGGVVHQPPLPHRVTF